VGRKNFGEKNTRPSHHSSRKRVRDGTGDRKARGGPPLN
jgi:hypothetical protein